MLYGIKSSHNMWVYIVLHVLQISVTGFKLFCCHQCDPDTPVNRNILNAMRDSNPKCMYLFLCCIACSNTVRKKLTGGWGIFANVPLTKPCILKARIHFFFKKTLFEKTFKGFVTFRRHGKQFKKCDLIIHIKMEGEHSNSVVSSDF